MRTKTLLLAAAMIAAGIDAIQAQSNVYSQNVVGYYNIVIPAAANNTRLKLVTMQLKPNGITTPTLNNSVTNAPGGDVLGAHLWTQTGAGGWSGLDTFSGTDWPDQGTVAIPYGSAFFLKNVANVAPITVTFVGEVPQGANLQNHWNTFVHPSGSLVPVAGKLVTDLKWSHVNEVAQQWNHLDQGSPGGLGWSGQNQYLGANDDDWSDFPQPTLAVGEGIIIRGASKTWDRAFTVQ